MESAHLETNHSPELPKWQGPANHVSVNYSKLSEYVHMELSQCVSSGY